MAKKVLYIFLGVFIYLFSGVYENDEFNEKFFFIKKYPTYKWYFYSPRNLSDMKIEEMNDEQKYEQIMYDKYVHNRILSIPITIHW